MQAIENYSIAWTAGVRLLRALTEHDEPLERGDREGHILLGGVETLDLGAALPHDLLSGTSGLL
jgi:hypothetical protein